MKGPSWLTRAWRRLRFARRGVGCPVVFARAYELAVPGTAIDPQRAARILTFLHSRKLLRPQDLHRAPVAPLSHLLAVHTEPYLSSLQDPGSPLTFLGDTPSEQRLDEFLTAHRTAVGGTILASELARCGRSVAIHLSGGFHHASRDRGHGFCVFNDVAAAIFQLRSRGYDAPFLVVDLDLHDGDGTRAIFRDDPSVFTFSIHNQHLASIEALASFDLELGGDVEDATYLAALHEHLPAIVDTVRPGLVFYLAGCDPAVDDPLGNWRISAAGLLDRDRFVLSTLQSHDPDLPIVILLAGGYGGEAWRYSARFFATILSGGETLEPPPRAELLLTEYRALSRRLTESELTREKDEDWSLSQEDLPGTSGAWAMPQSRLLGYYSRHGFELVLERYGILDQLRARGFEQVRVDFDLNNPAGQTVLVRTDDAASETLIELRVRRDTGTIQGMELLAVEWLLLQDPRASFGPGRPRLPGQHHPGLGLLKEIAAILVMFCERIGLDGLRFTPAYFHLAVQSRRLLSFLDPAREGHFRALQKTLRELRLPEAIRAIDGGRVIDAGTNLPLAWTPSVMVLPVSRRLKARVTSESYLRQVEEAEARARFHLPTY